MKYVPASELSNEAYHASPGISKSGLDLINQTPAHYYERYLNPNREVKEPTPALVFGSAFHAILESEELFKRDYICGIEADRRTKEGKLQHAAFAEAAEGRTVLKPEDFERLHRMRDKLYSRHSMRTLLDLGVESEPSYFWDQPGQTTLYSAPARCRPDLIAKSRDFILDFKTTVSAKREDFETSAWSYRYHVQAAWYLMGASTVTKAPIDTFLFVAVEKTAPFACQIFEAPIEFLRRGYEQMFKDFDRYAECYRLNQWPDYPDEISTMNLPRWVK